MISTPSVLVLGAGASYDFGFPLGRALKNLIVEGISQTDQNVIVLSDLGFSQQEQGEFSAALRQSGARSVDAFLEYRDDLIPIGKAAIAAALIPCEKTQALHALLGSPHWLENLFDRMRAPKD